MFHLYKGYNRQIPRNRTYRHYRELREERDWEVIRYRVLLQMVNILEMANSDG
jgi:hypothetical protein